MNKFIDKIICSDVPYICLLDTRYSNEDGYRYQILTYFYDEDFDIGSYLGIAKDKNCSYEEFKEICFKSKTIELEELRKKITKDEYFFHNDEILPSYFALQENLKKYKKRKLGNPDVIKVLQYEKEHPEVMSFETHYDIKYYAQFVDMFPKEVINNIVLTTKFISREENATLERRKEINDYIMDIKLDEFNLKQELYHEFFKNIEDDFNHMKRKLFEYLDKYPEVYLFYISSYKNNNKVFTRLNFPIKNLSFKEFSIDTFINFKANILYRISN